MSRESLKDLAKYAYFLGQNQIYFYFVLIIMEALTYLKTVKAKQVSVTAYQDLQQISLLNILKDQTLTFIYNLNLKQEFFMLFFFKGYPQKIVTAS